MAPITRSLPRILVKSTGAWETSEQYSEHLPSKARVGRVSGQGKKTQPPGDLPTLAVGLTSPRHFPGLSSVGWFVRRTEGPEVRCGEGRSRERRQDRS